MKIIWIDGTYGVGKTSVAFSLKKRLQNCIVYDSDEYWNIIASKDPLAFLWGGTLPQNKIYFLNNFKDIIIDGLHENYLVVVPMTLTMDECKKYLLDPINHEVSNDFFHVILYANKDTVVKRIAKDEWRDCDFTESFFDRNVTYLKQNYPDAYWIDVESMGIEDIVNIIINQCNLKDESNNE